MYKPLPDGLTIKESDVQGLGLFATRDFDADVVLGIVHVLNKNFPHGSIRTALGAFYNHSDNPNCKNVAGFWHQLPVKYLITTKPIKEGEEQQRRTLCTKILMTSGNKSVILIL